VGAEPTVVAARLRGTAAGLLTATLAVAAHGAAGGALPQGSAAVLLGVLAATVGGLAATLAHAADARVMVGLLATGQLVGHAMLSAAGHSHGGSGSPTAAMLLAHATAVVAAAMLIGAADRLCRAVSRVVEVATRVVIAPVPGRSAVVIAADQPLRSILLLAASMSHRGPPVSRSR
jgi:hypothetical protein